MSAKSKAFKSTRYQTTEYNRSQRLLSRLRYIYSGARIFHLSHAEILRDLGEKIYSTRDYAKLTAYYVGVFHGWRSALADGLYDHLEWRVYLDGRLVQSKDVPEGQWFRVKGGEHVWKDAPDRIFSTPDLTSGATDAKSSVQEADNE